MLCIYCLKPSTAVVNSRQHKKNPITWRRRKCLSCDSTFTTDEKPRIGNKMYVLNPKTKEESEFNPGRLVISIALAFQHDEAKGRQDAWHLMETIAALLVIEHPLSLTSDNIVRTTHQTLARYDKAAAIQYALHHHLLRLG